MKQQLEIGVAEERTRHAAEIARLQAGFDEERVTLRGQIDRLVEQVEAERKERGYLNDRLCQKLGLAPIHEASPGEIALRKDQAERGKVLRAGPRAAAVAAGVEAFDKDKQAIKTEVDLFLKQQSAEAQPSDGPSGNSDNR